MCSCQTKVIEFVWRESSMQLKLLVYCLKTTRLPGAGRRTEHWITDPEFPSFGTLECLGIYFDVMQHYQIHNSLWLFLFVCIDILFFHNISWLFQFVCIDILFFYSTSWLFLFVRIDILAFHNTSELFLFHVLTHCLFIILHDCFYLHVLTYCRFIILHDCLNLCVWSYTVFYNIS